MISRPINLSKWRNDIDMCFLSHRKTTEIPVVKSRIQKVNIYHKIHNYTYIYDITHRENRKAVYIPNKPNPIFSPLTNPIVNFSLQHLILTEANKQWYTATLF